MSTQLPDNEPIDIWKGDYYPFDFVIEEDGVTVDFSNHSNEVLEVIKPNDGTVLDTYQTSDGTLSTSSNGRVQADWLEGQTESWPDVCYYELRSNDAAGNQRTWLVGTITLKEEPG